MLRQSAKTHPARRWLARVLLWWGPLAAQTSAFIYATVGQGGNDVNACKSLELDTVKCRGHRVNRAIMWALGLAGASPKCKNPLCKTLVGKGASLVGAFSHSDVSDRVKAERLTRVDVVPSLAHSCTDEDFLRSQSLQSKLDRELQEEFRDIYKLDWY